MVTIQQATRSGDGAGGVTLSWAEYASVWAAVEPVPAEERLRADATAAPITHTVTMRWLAGVRPDMRIIHDGRTLQIVSPPINTEERDSELVVLCREYTP